MPRRGENIIKRNDGRWEARVLLGHDKTGKSHYKSLYAHSYREVKQKKCDFIKANSAGEHTVDTVLSVAEQWLKTVKIRCKSSTHCKYDSICRLHIIPHIGKYRIDAVEISDIAEILEDGNKSSATQKLIICVLKMLMKFSGKGENIDFSCVYPKSVPKKITVLTRQEQQKLIDFLISSTDNCKLGVYLCLCTGLRLGELCALRRNDISFAENMLSVKGTMQRISSENSQSKTEMIISKPKTSSSERMIPLPKVLTQVVKKQYEALSGDCYLLSGTEKPIIPRTLQNRFKNYLKSAGVNITNFHVLRHTFATRCIENGMDIRTLSEILGHSSVNITLQRYVHPSLEAKRESMEMAVGKFL